MQDSTDVGTVNLRVAISRSDRLHGLLVEALGNDWSEDSLRASVTLDACNLSLEHGTALRRLLEAELESSGLSMLRLQFEALLRAAWVLYAAADHEVAALAAPLTAGTSRAAKSLPMSADLLSAVEQSPNAPPPLKRALREFRSTSWEALNSYVHSGIHPLRRMGAGHPTQDLVNAVLASNALNYATFMLLATMYGSDELANDVNVIVSGHPECMPEKHA